MSPATSPALLRWQAQLAVAICSLLLFAFGGCRRAPRAELVFLNGAECEILDPAAFTAQASSRVAYAVYEGLTAWTADGRPSPGVAERWEVSPNGRVYTFHLRKEARWSNGDPVTTRDFIYAWRRVLLPETAAEYASQLYSISGAQHSNIGGDFTGEVPAPWLKTLGAVANGAFRPAGIVTFAAAGARALDDHTLEVILRAPTAYFLDITTFSTLLPVHRATVENYPDFSSNPAHFVGNGAFVMEEWRLFDRLRLKKNPRYWNAAEVRLNSIDVLPVDDAMTAYNLYATGQADLIIDKKIVPSPLMGELRNRPDFHAAPFLGNYFIRFNVKSPGLTDPRVRRAIGMVIDKGLLVEKITKAKEPPAYSITPPGTGDNYQPPPGLDYNVAAARQLLAEAGHPMGAGLPVMRYLFDSKKEVDRSIAVEIQGMLKTHLGITMELVGQEWTAYLKTQSQMDYDLSRSSWVADYNDPNTFLNMFVTGDGNNRTGYSSAQYDALIEKAAYEPDTKKRLGHFQQAERLLIAQDAVICPIYYWVGVQLYDDAKLGGLVANKLDEHGLKHIFWKQPR